MKHDVNDSLSLHSQTTFRILYWASYLGKSNIVEKIIRQGYSPFVVSFDQKNSLMAALDGKQLATVELILSFTYIPFHPEKFEKSKLATDSYGNTPLHLAYKNKMQEEVTRLMKEQGGEAWFKEMANFRNHRGMRAKGMTVNELEENVEPDYVLVVKEERGDFILK